jgi:serine/threonine-protein kinase
VWVSIPAPDRSLTRFTVPLPEGQRFTNAGRQVVALSPDGANLVYVANTRLFLRPLSALQSREIQGSEDIFSPGTGVAGVLHPAFSPDGTALVYYSNADRALKRIALSGGAAVKICEAEIPFGISWDESGIAFGQRGRGVLRVSANGGVPEVIATVDADQVASSPQMLPGGRAVLFSVLTGNTWDKAQVVAQPLDGGPRKTLVDGGADARYLPTGHLVYALAGMLLAVPFDAGTLTVSGGPVPVIEGVRRAGLNRTATGVAQFSVARNGSLAYVPGPIKLGSEDEGTDLAIFDRKGESRPFKLPPAAYGAPRVSPDGKTVAFDSVDEADAIVWLYDLDGTSAIRRLTFGGRNRAPVWSADGQWVVYQSNRDGDEALFRQRADGSGTPERLTKPEKGTWHAPQSSSPDGEHLLFSAAVGDRHSLWTLALKDRRIAPFGNVQTSDNVEGEFSPDGKWVAYFSFEAGSNQVFVQPFPATGAKYLVPQIGGAPQWLGKGDELLINALPSRSATLAFTATPRVTFGRPMEFQRSHFEGNPRTSRRNADATPDGQHIVGVLPRTTAARDPAAFPEQVTIVLNWLDEVRQRVR